MLRDVGVSPELLEVGKDTDPKRERSGTAKENRVGP